MSAYWQAFVKHALNFYCLHGTVVRSVIQALFNIRFQDYWAHDSLISPSSSLCVFSYITTSNPIQFNDDTNVCVSVYLWYSKQQEQKQQWRQQKRAELNVL